MTQTDPPTPPSKEQTTPRGRMPSPPALEREKKPNKKIEPPVLAAIISAVATLITAIMGSPFIFNLVDKANPPVHAPPTALVTAPDKLLSGNLLRSEISKATPTPQQSSADSVVYPSTPQEGDPTSPPPLPGLTPTATTLPPEQPDPPIAGSTTFFQCIAAELWAPFPSTMDQDTSDGCWNLTEWGFSTDQDRLWLVHNPELAQQRGIYTPISGDVDIRFIIQLNELRMRVNKAGFLYLGIVQADPFDIYKGGFLNYQQTAPGTASPVRVLISGSNQGIQNISSEKAGFEHEVLISVEGDRMVVFLNGEQAGDPVGLPPTDRAFWIGYYLPAKSELDGVISNFTIQSR